MVSVFLFSPVGVYNSITVEMQVGKLNNRLSFKKLELLGFFCNFLCSLYNAQDSTFVFPYWNEWYTWLNSELGWPQIASSFVHFLYSLNFNFQNPASLPPAGWNGVGILVFSFIWSVLPFLYVLYFFVLFIESDRAPYVTVQRLLCLFGIFHFLFFTDFAGYRFGRGWANLYGEWFHWSERFAWRIGILLPVYQNYFSGFLKKKSGYSVLHYFMMLWGLAFFVYEVLIFDVLRFISFVSGEKLIILEHLHAKYYTPKFGYLGALVLISIYYLFRLISNAKSHLWVIRAHPKTRWRSH
jgi:hypothetical protein